MKEVRHPVTVVEGDRYPYGSRVLSIHHKLLAYVTGLMGRQQPPNLLIGVQILGDMRFRLETTFSKLTGRGSLRISDIKTFMRLSSSG